MTEELQAGDRVIATIDVTHVAQASGEQRNSQRNVRGVVTGLAGPLADHVNVMLDDEGLVVSLRRAQVRLAVPDDVLDNVRSVADPAIAAQVLDARLARQAKDVADLGHIAEQTRVQAAADVGRINLIRRRLRTVFHDLPGLDAGVEHDVDLDDSAWVDRLADAREAFRTAPPPTHICNACGERIEYGAHALGCPGCTCDAVPGELHRPGCQISIARITRGT